MKRSIWMFVLVVVALGSAWAQDSGTTSSEPGSPPPQDAAGQQNAPPPITENPPITGLDLPPVEPHAAPLSYIQPGATVSESYDSNLLNATGSGSQGSISRAVGSLTMQRLWSHYDLALDYVGGFAYYDTTGAGFRQLQQMDLQQKILWKRGQLSVRDSFSYLPEGNFGGAYGSMGSQGIESLGNTSFGGFWGGSGLGTLGLTPRILNVSVADLTENLTAKSALTAAGGYAFTHFYGDSSGVNFIGSSQVSAQVGYDRLLTAHTQVALTYGYQGFDFSSLNTAFHTHVIQGLYGYRFSGRMDLLMGAGPQITRINSQGCTLAGVPAALCVLAGGQLTTVVNTKLGVAAQARLRYKFTRSELQFEYQRYQTSGAGFFAGAQTDLARVSWQRPLNRVWNGFVDMGYSRNERLQASAGGVPADLYQYGFAGGGVQRAFGRNFHGFASYQFNELAFDHQYCTTAAPCSRISNRHVVTFGLDWTPRPIRID